MIAGWVVQPLARRSQLSSELRLQLLHCRPGTPRRLSRLPEVSDARRSPGSCVRALLNISVFNLGIAAGSSAGAWIEFTQWMLRFEPALGAPFKISQPADGNQL